MPPLPISNLLFVPDTVQPELVVVIVWPDWMIKVWLLAVKLAGVEPPPPGREFQFDNTAGFPELRE